MGSVTSSGTPHAERSNVKSQITPRAHECRHACFASPPPPNSEVQRQHVPQRRFHRIHHGWRRPRLVFKYVPNPIAGQQGGHHVAHRLAQTTVACFQGQLTSTGTTRSAGLECVKNP